MDRLNLIERLDPAALVEAEQILQQLGLPLDTAMNLFLRQIVLQKGLPFPVSLPKDAAAGGAQDKETAAAQPVPTREDVERDIQKSIEEMKQRIRIPMVDWDE